MKWKSVSGTRPVARRHRGLYLGLIAVVICLGLLSRSDWPALPPWLAKYLGDALWGLMIYLGIGLLLPAKSITFNGLSAGLVCATVECSQLYHVPWLDTVRQTWIGRMTLGYAFGWGDLFAYLMGIVFGMFFEWIMQAGVCSTKLQ